MDRNIQKSIVKLDKIQDKLLNKVEKESQLKGKIYEKVPMKLCDTLETAFAKAFELVFLHGTGVIEKTFDKVVLASEFNKNDYIADIKGNKKSLNGVDKPAAKSNAANSLIATFSGLGLGALGIGVPDIPIFVGTILKGVYQIAVSYGFSYDTDIEKIYILRLIRTAVSTGDKKLRYNTQLENITGQTAQLKEEIAITAKVLSDAMLVEKFVQGLPIVGVVGGYFNHQVYKKIAKLGVIKYKKRYLRQKLGEN
ncbi:MAG: EcsC family protein [Oscillospiraceae bacterium]